MGFFANLQSLNTLYRLEYCFDEKIKTFQRHLMVLLQRDPTYQARQRRTVDQTTGGQLAGNLTTSEAFLIDKNVANLIGERNKNRNAKSFRLAFSARHQCHWFREYKIAVKALPSHPEVKMLAKCLLTILLVAVLYGSGANAQTVADDIRLRFYFG